jgi:glycyl-tRNA synthetase alpha chain
MYIASLRSFGIDPLAHDIRFVETTGNPPPSGPGAWMGGVGSTAWRSQQFTYFQQVGGFDLNPICVEITYGIERIAMYLQKVDNVYDLEWGHGIRYGDVHHKGEVEFSTYNFEKADVPMLRSLFDLYEKESVAAAGQGLVLPAYDYCLKCSHVFNILDAGAPSA